MEFKLDPKADTNGTSLQAYLPQMTHEQMHERFGDPRPGGYEDADKGYDGEEWSFVDEYGAVVNVYARYGDFRVGAHNARVADNFVEWLGKKVE